MQPFHTYSLTIMHWMATVKKKTENKKSCEDAEIVETLYTVGWNVK